MADVFNIEMVPRDRMEEILPLVGLLNNNSIPPAILRERLQIMLANGYECLGAYHQGRLIGICGVWTLYKFYVGKHLEPDNVFIMPEYRGRGVGKLMMDKLFAHAREIGCEASEVNCYIKNEKGKQFWMNQGYDPIGYHMQKVF